MTFEEKAKKFNFVKFRKDAAEEGVVYKIVEYDGESLIVSPNEHDFGFMDGSIVDGECIFITDKKAKELGYE